MHAPETVAERAEIVRESSETVGAVIKERGVPGREREGWSAVEAR